MVVARRAASLVDGPAVLGQNRFAQPQSNSEDEGGRGQGLGAEKRARERKSHIGMDFTMLALLLYHLPDRPVERVSR